MKLGLLLGVEVPVVECIVEWLQASEDEAVVQMCKSRPAERFTEEQFGGCIWSIWFGTQLYLIS